MLVHDGCLVHRDDAFWGRWSVAKGAVRADRVVVTPPLFDQDLSLAERIEDLAVQQFISKPRVEDFAVSVLPGRPRFDERRLGASGCDPGADLLSNELGTVVRTDELRDTTQDEQIGQSINDIGRVEPSCDADRQGLLGVLIDDIEHPELPTVMGAVFHEVIAPDMVAPFRTEPDAGAVVEPQTPLLSLFLWHFQPFTPPDPFHALVVHVPARAVQQSGDHPIAVPTVLAGKLDDVVGQTLFVGDALRNFALGRAMLTENPTGAAL